MTTAWKPSGLGPAPVDGIGHPPVIAADEVTKILPGIDLWDIWPARTSDGSIAAVCGQTLWAALSAPVSNDPSKRHDIAAIRLLLHDPDDRWHDLGPMFEPHTALGSRQWAGAMTVHNDRLSVFYTAAGSANGAQNTFAQRLYSSSTSIECRNGRPHFGSWTDHVELFGPDARYDQANDGEGTPGFIKAFRDPFPFVDPANGARHIFFTGSLAPQRSRTEFNGVIGVADYDAANDSWMLGDPVIAADGVNNELERPHVVVNQGLYYLFFSTQARTFHPSVTGPTGLFGFVAEQLGGPYAPLNGHALVFTNPPSEPLQAYSWLVLNDLTTISFIDAYALQGTGYLDGSSDEVAADSECFGGTIAPAIRLGLDGDRAWIEDSSAAIPR